MIIRLSRPAVVGAGIVFRPVALRTQTTQLNRGALRREIRTIEHLVAPTVIGAGRVFRSTKVNLALGNRMQRKKVGVIQPYTNTTPRSVNDVAVSLPHR